MGDTPLDPASAPMQILTPIPCRTPRAYPPLCLHNLTFRPRRIYLVFYTFLPRFFPLPSPVPPPVLKHATRSFSTCLEHAADRDFVLVRSQFSTLFLISHALQFFFSTRRSNTPFGHTCSRHATCVSRPELFYIFPCGLISVFFRTSRMRKHTSSCSTRTVTVISSAFCVASCVFRSRFLSD